jgi:hypothetical protein
LTLAEHVRFVFFFAIFAKKVHRFFVFGCWIPATVVRVPLAPRSESNKSTARLLYFFSQKIQQKYIPSSQLFIEKSANFFGEKIEKLF